MHLTAICRFSSCRNGLTRKIVRVMNITAVFLLATCLAAGAVGHSQKVTLSLKNAPLEKVFREIQKQTGFDFLFTRQMLKEAHPVDVEVKDATVQEAMRVCLKNQPLDFVIDNNAIVIQQKLSAVMSNTDVTLSVAEVDVHGRVVNENGEAVASASIVVKGDKTKGTTTDADGNFSLKGVDENATLIISGVNIESFEVKVKSRTDLATLTATTKVTKLDELQFIAYGQTTKRYSTGSISKITSDEISQQPVSNPLAAIEGRASGIQITQQTGVPGGGFKVLIRGQNSLRDQTVLGSAFVEGNNPFYIIDGVPYNSNSFQQLNGANATAGTNIQASPLNFLNPSDIESIEILKDADATAIYGSRGANGVVLITTKSGKAGKTKVEVNTYAGAGAVTRTRSYLNLRQYLDMRHEAFKNDNANPSTFDNDINGTWDTTRYTDWQKLLIGGTAHYYDAQTTISGGNQFTQFIMGGTYHKETTVFPGDFADQKASARIGVKHQSENKKFIAQMNADYMTDNNTLMGTDLTNFINTPPDAPPIYDNNGKLNWLGSFSNPFQYVLRTYSNKGFSLISSSLLSYQIADGLKAKINLGYTQTRTDENSTKPISSQNPIGVVTGSVVQASLSLNTWIAEPQITYDRNFNFGRIEALVGTSFQENKLRTANINATGFPNDNLLGIISNATSITSSINNTLYHYNAVFGRIKYSINDKYIVDLTARRDASSRFGAGKQFGNFGSGAAAWIFTKEKFSKDLFPFLSFGKLRMSYGTTGNDQIGDYGYLSTYSSTNITYQGLVGLMPSRLDNPLFSWEVTRKIDASLDLGILKDRVVFNFSYYRNRSSNQLVGFPLSTVTGFNSIQSNFPAVVQNMGWEFELQANPIKTKQFSWSSGFNLTIPKNRLVSFKNIQNTVFNNYYVVGQPLSILKGFKLIGVDTATGRFQFADSQGQPTFTPSSPSDNIYHAFRGQYFYGGFQNSINYRGFILDVLFQFAKQTGINNAYSGLPGSALNQLTTVLDRWQKPGDIATIQRFNQDYSLYSLATIAISQSNFAVINASYVRLKNLSLSYFLSGKWMQKLHLQTSRIYIQGQNLLTITKYKNADPESQNPLTLPPLKVITAGIQITF